MENDEKIYEIIKPLGEGSSGIVFEAIKEKKEKVAIKCIFKLEGYDKLNEDLKDEVINEIRIMKLLENEYSIKLLEYFEDQVAYYLVEELMPNNLENYIFKLFQNKQELTSENTKTGFKNFIKKFIPQFCIAYSKLLEYNIEHNDLKLRNILINDNFDIKLCDYNCSKINNIYKTHTKSLTLKIKDIKSKFNSKNLNKELNSDLISFSYIIKFILSKEYLDENKNKKHYFEDEEFKHIYKLINDILNGKENISWKNIFELEKIKLPEKKFLSLKQIEINFQNKKLLENFILEGFPDENNIKICNKYKIISGIGKGGNGIVVKGLDLKKEKDNKVAIKLFLNYPHMNEEYKKIYVNESEKMKVLSQEGNNYFVKWLDESFSNKNKIFYFIVMEYINSNLELEFDNNRIIRDNDKRKILLQLLNGIKYMKENQIIHSDLKLNNILFDIKDINTYNYNIKITDFGSDEDTEFSSIAGTPLYLASELIFYLFEQKKFSI